MGTNHIVAVGDKSTGRQQEQAHEEQHNASRNIAAIDSVPLFWTLLLCCGKLGRGEFEHRTDFEASSTLRYVVMFCAGISSEEAVEIPLFWSFAYSAAVASVVSKADVCQL
ncbi:unnamed protein product [Sphagnum tenellum]